ncbi:MAG: aminotransferase class IV family protein [Synergistales bacterium]|nr:aminotransferase class IV family protein [Synergistales bacterium]
MHLCYMGKKFLPLENASLPVTDLIIQRGVGVFDSIATHNRRPIRLTAHLERLERSALESGIRPPLTIEEMRSLALEGIDKMEMEYEVVIKPYITGGDSFDHSTGSFPSPRFFMIFQSVKKPFPESYQKGVSLHPIDTERIMPHAKTINYMISFTAQAEDLDSFEILYCPRGEITEASHSSFFLVRDGILVTAPLEKVLQGTTRELVMLLARENGISLEERCPSLSEIPYSQEAFLTGSIKEILPVVKIGEQNIGTGKPGPVTRKLREIYLDNIHRWLE